MLSTNEPSSEKEPRPVLDDGERRILQVQLEADASSAGFFAIYRFATNIDVLYIVGSTVACAAAGVSVPLMMAVLGALAGNFSGHLTTADSDPGFVGNVNHNVLYFVYIGVAQLVLVSTGMYGLNMAGERITTRLRRAFLAAVLRQNVAFFDSVGAGEIAVRMSNDMNLVQDGISQKIGIIASGVAGFFAAIILSFIYNWRVALVLLCIPALIIVIMGGCGAAMKRFQEKATAEYGQTSSFAEEVLSCIRNVIAYGSQSRLMESYKKSLDSPERADFIAQGILGLMLSALFAVINLAYGLAFWQGNRFFENGEVTIGQLITVMFSTAIAGTLLGQAVPHVAAVVQAGAASRRIFATIERESPIDATKDFGEKIQNLRGTVDFIGVKMVYPSRQDQVILDHFNLTIPATKTVAVVGPSGSGKTTLLSLLERLYLPLCGSVTLDGISIADLNLRWLRSQIGIVAQDNFLFDTSILDNIAYGLGPEYDVLDPQEVRKRVEEAAYIAHAHHFIQDLPKGYDTNVGSRGSRLSGGQRQRIAIARAIIANPKILMLDEATAALDTESEQFVQEALFSAAVGRTTIIVAHRLSTIRRADLIVVMDKGKVTESGTHHQLMEAQATYASLVKAQQLRQEVNTDHVEGLGRLKAPESGASESTAIYESERAFDVAQVRRRENPFINLLSLIWRLNAPEKKHLIVGLICSIMAGTGYPISGIFFGNAVVALTDPDLANGGHSVNFWCLMFLMFGIVLLVAYGIQGWTFAYAGARLGSQARKEAFKSILRQDIAFFEKEENRPGILTAFLSAKATKLRGIGGATLGAVTNSIMSLVGGIAVSVSFGWKLGLVATACMPVLLLCGFLRFWVVSRVEARVKRTTTAAAKAAEAVSAIQTVATLTMEDTVLRQYTEHVSQGSDQNKFVFDLGVAMTYALSMALVQFVNALIFWYGGAKLIGGGEYTIRQFFICYASSVFSAQGAGAIFSFAPEVAGAQEAAAELKYLLDSQPVIEKTATNDLPDEKEHSLEGEVKLSNVSFAYPTQKEYPVLTGINLAAHRGQLVALVGGSGSGKSTVVNLLERFYDPTSGTVLVDQKDLRHINLHRYRKQVALVEQESPLVGGSIRECLLSEDESISDNAIEQACRDADISDFVVSNLPQHLLLLVKKKGDL
ncbi:MAG: hypothetical protein Q9227_003088 [Pyrenula ochraceoflavens]